jgi:hypothetical protein
VPIQRVCTLSCKGAVPKYYEVFHGLRFGIRTRILVEELVAGAAAGHKVEHVFDPWLFSFVPFSRPWDYMIDRHIKPGLVALEQIAPAIHTTAAALIEHRGTISMTARSITASRCP